ncbi:transposase [Macrococcus hajekii]|uniref:transposase n=1 Tax=Macrococcus hajekii TaxID=198482 RepID=UPI00357123B2
MCPENHELKFSFYSTRKNGDFSSASKVYQCEMCQSCFLKHKCISKNTKGNKRIFRNNNLEYFRTVIRKKLSDKNTREIYAQRKIDVGPVFGFLKAILVTREQNCTGNPK